MDAVLARDTPSGGTAWYLTDAIGSVGDIIDNSGDVLDHIDYSAFGEILDESDPSEGDRFKFAGLTYDTATALNLAQYRAENAENGRWITQDPMQFLAGDTNLYRYVGNKPTGTVDPDGLAPPFDTTITGISGGVISDLKKYPPGNPLLTFPGGYQASGPCANFAQAMSKRLNYYQIPHTLKHYHIDANQFSKDNNNPLYIYHAPDGTQLNISAPMLSAHVIVEVTVMSNGKQTTMLLDAGRDVGGLHLGNVGDPKTGVIAPANCPLLNANGNKQPILKPYLRD